MLCTPNQDARRPTKSKPQRFPWFDPWLVAKGASLRLLVTRTATFIDHHEASTRARKRARKSADQKLHAARVEIVVANLARAVLSPTPKGRLAVLVGHRLRTRYDNPALGEPLSALLWMLHELGVLDYRHSRQRGEACSIAPTAWFAKRVAEAGVALSDFGRHPNEEVISLTQNNTPGAGGITHSHRQRVNYRDTRETTQYREEMRRLNAFIEAADIAFVDDCAVPTVDIYDRHQRRHFVVRGAQPGPRFDQSGRLFGGFWQNLKSTRREHIRINGEPVADLDYGSMFTRLAYAELGSVPPAGDLYAIPDLEGYRSGVKMAMNTFLFDQSPRRSKWPVQMGVGCGDDAMTASVATSKASTYDGRLPAEWGVGRTKKAILGVHPALRSAWGRGLGHRLMFLESQILVAVLLRLLDRGIPALGIHDSLLVAESDADVAVATMIDVARAVVGADLPVKVKSPLTSFKVVAESPWQDLRGYASGGVLATSIPAFDQEAIR